MWIQPLVSFSVLFLIIWRFFALSPWSRGNLAIFVRCSERTPRFYSVEFYGTDLYNFKSSYFSIHAEYSSITTKNMLKRYDLKKKVTASHLYFLNIVLLLYYVLQSPKRKKKLWNKCSFYKMMWNCVWDSSLCLPFSWCGNNQVIFLRSIHDSTHCLPKTPQSPKCKSQTFTLVTFKSE